MIGFAIYLYMWLFRMLVIKPTRWFFRTLRRNARRRRQYEAARRRRFEATRRP